MADLFLDQISHVIYYFYFCDIKMRFYAKKGLGSRIGTDSKVCYSDLYSQALAQALAGSTLSIAAMILFNNPDIFVPTPTIINPLPPLKVKDPLTEIIIKKIKELFGQEAEFIDIGVWMMVILPDACEQMDEWLALLKNLEINAVEESAVNSDYIHVPPKILIRGETLETLLRKLETIPQVHSCAGVECRP